MLFYQMENVLPTVHQELILPMVCVNLAISLAQLVWDRQDIAHHVHRHNFYTTEHAMITVHDMTRKANVWHNVLLDFTNLQTLHVYNVHKLVHNVAVQINAPYVRVVYTHILVTVLALALPILTSDKTRIVYNVIAHAVHANPVLQIVHNVHQDMSEIQEQEFVCSANQLKIVQPTVKCVQIMYAHNVISVTF